ILAAAASVEALTICDATQGFGWLPIDGSLFDAVACTAYKWLMSPRGSAFLSVSDRLLERVVPHSAGWYSGEDPHSSYFGPPLRLAATARQLDLSPAWFSWVGTTPALELGRADRSPTDPRAQPRARKPVPGWCRPRARRQRDRVRRPSRGGAAALAGGD